MNSELRVVLILISSIIQVVMQNCIPIAGGGAGLMLVLSIPILIGLGIIFALIDYIFIRKIKNQSIKNILFIIMESLLVGLAICTYPFV